MAAIPIFNLGGDSDSSEEDEELPEHVVQSVSAAETVDTLKALQESFIGRFGATSVEFQEASQLVLVDCWNVGAWLTMVEEVERGRGGNTSTAEVYLQFLDQFPRAAKMWRALIEYYLVRDDIARVEEAFKSCLSKCRSVPLWVFYLGFTKGRTVDKISKHSEQYANAKKSVEAAFEQAIENVGTVCEASALWRKYVDFVKEWPDMSPMDAGIKMKMLREVYQRALALPIDDLDDFWSEYEALENSTGEHLAAQLLPELRTKYQHAKLVNNDRRRLASKIVFDRIATPPSNSLSELQQLDSWNKLLKFEVSNPGRLSSELHVKNVRCLFEQALCCLRHHAEVWLAYSKFELGQSAADPMAGGLQDNVKFSKTVLSEGIECNPQLTLLRVALAELEESSGNISAARDALRAAFVDIPNAFTFSVLQKFIRRFDGKTAARKFFSETMSARLDGLLNFEVYLAHASLEADINQDLCTALKAMELARIVRPSLGSNVNFVLSSASILRRLGNMDPIRWLFHAALGDASFKHIHIGKATNETDSAAAAEHYVVNKKSRLLLWEEYLRIEMSLGLSNIERLAQLKASVLEAREAAFPQGAPKVVNPAVLPSDEYLFYEYPSELIQKYLVSGVSLPLLDSSVKDRCRGSAFIDDLIRESELDGSGTDKKGKNKRPLDVSSALDTDSSILAGLPAFFRELLAKLPNFSGPAVDVDAFVDSLRRTVLPPRPMDEPFSRRPNYNDNRAAQQTVMPPSKRARRTDESLYDGGVGIIEDPDILGETDDVSFGFQAEEDATTAIEGRDDVFKKRHRQKLALE